MQQLLYGLMRCFWVTIQKQRGQTQNIGSSSFKADCESRGSQLSYANITSVS